VAAGLAVLVLLPLWARGAELGTEAVATAETAPRWVTWNP
jgi:hypothetical protein